MIISNKGISMGQIAALAGVLGSLWLGYEWINKDIPVPVPVPDPVTKVIDNTKDFDVEVGLEVIPPEE